jgi:hypothetical protein
VGGAGGSTCPLPFGSSVAAPKRSVYRIAKPAKMSSAPWASGVDAGAVYQGEEDGEAPNAGMAPTTPKAFVLEEKARYKTFKMQSLLKTLQEVSAGIADLGEQKETPEDEDTANEIMTMAAKLQSQCRVTSRYSWTPTKLPTFSSMELVFKDLSADIPEERLVELLGGGDAVRDVKYANDLTFVAFYTVFDCNEQFETAMASLARDKWSASSIARARFRADLHMHEVSNEVPKPHYRPFHPRKAYVDWGTSKTRREKKTTGAASSGSGALRVRVEIGPPSRKRHQGPASDSS